MEDKTIWADDIVRSSQNISEIEGNYCLLCDKIVTWKFDSLIKSINKMNRQGWECVSIVATAGNLYALMKRGGK